MPDFGTLSAINQLKTARQMLSDLPGDLGSQRVAPVYMDGVLIESLRDAVDATDFQAGQRQSQGARFWATKRRLQDTNPIRDVFEVDLSVPRLVNQIAFDLAHFPHRAVVEYCPSGAGAWLPLLDANGNPIVIEVIDSNPPILPQNANPSLTHPQHFGAGHWLSQDIKTQPVSVSRCRIVLTRPNGGLPPTDSQGNAVAYSLGVRAFVLGYEVDSDFDIPARSLVPGSITTYRPIEVTRDLLGSTVSYAERKSPAANLLIGGSWRCEPQPLPYAVVNLYLDVRISGQPTVIERFFIDPITSGCSVNLYYTLGAPDLTAADPWAFVEWTPVGRDFAVRRGYMRFDPTRAAYFKFEFTDLAPEPYDATNALVRTVNLFPAGLESQDPITRSGNDGGAGTVINGALDGILRYNDNDRPGTAGLTDLSRGYSPTEVFYSKDPSAAARLRDLSPFYNYLPWQGGTQAPHWPGTQVHHYIQSEVLHDQRVAFYIALANITAYRLNYGFNEDTDQYLDYFFDDANIALNTGWALTPGDLATPLDSDGPWMVTSEVLHSRSNVRGIQFATTQSPPLQLLPDDDFNSGVLGPAELAKNWATFKSGEASPGFAPSNDYNTDIGTTVIVTRDGTTEIPPRPANHNTYTQIGQFYGSWGAIEGSAASYADLARTTSPTDAARIGGIVSVNAVQPAPGARVYAAARVVSKIDLEEPLYIQIYDGTNVVAEASASVTANKIVEWDVSFDTSVGLVDPNLWSDVTSHYPTYSAMDGLTWNQIGTRPGVALAKPLYVRLAQKGIPNASWYVDALSLFEESIIWEFSNDGGGTWYMAPGIRNNPRGALIFPEAADIYSALTYFDIEGRDPGPTMPTYNQLGPTWSAIEHDPRTTMPDHTRLCWRATCGRRGQHINALSIRPWYVNSGRGILAHEGVNVAGPNQALYDHYQPIDDDPRYRLWDKPIPQAWYFFYRQFALLRSDQYVPTEVRSNTVLPEAFVVPHTAVVRSTDTLNDALVIPVGGATPPPPPAPPVEVLVEAFIYRSP
jgi:hypothetical protein